jgi:hypothetical protein
MQVFRAVVTTVGVAAVGGGGVFGQGTFMTAGCLYEECSGANPPQRVFCTGFIVAAADATSIAPGIDGVSACMPEWASAGQVEDVVVQYLRGHPADRDVAAAPVVAVSLSLAWPCP